MTHDTSYKNKIRFLSELCYGLITKHISSYYDIFNQLLQLKTNNVVYLARVYKASI